MPRIRSEAEMEQIRRCEECLRSLLKEVVEEKNVAGIASSLASEYFAVCCKFAWERHDYFKAQCVRFGLIDLKPCVLCTLCTTENNFKKYRIVMCDSEDVQATSYGKTEKSTLLKVWSYERHFSSESDNPENIRDIKEVLRVTGNFRDYSEEDLLNYITNSIPRNSLDGKLDTHFSGLRCKSQEVVDFDFWSSGAPISNQASLLRDVRERYIQERARWLERRDAKEESSIPTIAEVFAEEIAWKEATDKNVQKYISDFIVGFVDERNMDKIVSQLIPEYEAYNSCDNVWSRYDLVSMRRFPDLYPCVVFTIVEEGNAREVFRCVMYDQKPQAGIPEKTNPVQIKIWSHPNPPLEYTHYAAEAVTKGFKIVELIDDKVRNYSEREMFEYVSNLIKSNYPVAGRLKLGMYGMQCNSLKIVDFDYILRMSGSPYHDTKDTDDVDDGNNSSGEDWLLANYLRKSARHMELLLKSTKNL